MQRDTASTAPRVHGDPTPAGADADAAATGEASSGQMFDGDLEVTHYEHSPVDVLRLVVSGLLTIAVVLLTKFDDGAIDGFERALTRVLDVPAGWARFAVDLALVASVLVTVVALFLIPFITRRMRILGYVAASSVATVALMSPLMAWLGVPGPKALRGASAEMLARGISVDVVGSVAVVASFVAIGPFVGRRWRTFLLRFVIVLAVLRLVVASDESTHLMLVLLAGFALGTAVLLAFGRPSTTARRSSIVAALRSSGIPVATLQPASVDARGSVPYFATLDDGTRVFVKVLGSNERSADLLFRMYRAIRLRNVGDQRPFSSLRRSVEHEAFVALDARDVGVRTPRTRGVAPVGRESFLLSNDMLDGRSLDGVSSDELTPEVLGSLWEQIAILHRHRIAHRDLRLANVFLARDGEPWVIDFGFSEVGASDLLVQADVAQLLAATACRVGPERAVTPAVAALGRRAVGASLPRLQPAALSGATQTELKAHKGLLDQVSDEIERQCNVEEFKLEPVVRFGPKQALTLAAVAAVIYFLLPQLGDLRGMLSAVEHGDWRWLAPIVLASAMTYVAATFSALGSVPNALPFGPTAAAQLACSFTGKVAPGGLGGMATNVRFLQREGVDSAVATASVGLKSAGGGVAHVTLSALFLVWAGRNSFGRIHLPSPTALLKAAIVIVAITAIALAIPAVRRRLREGLLPIIRRAAHGLSQVLTTPDKVTMLLAGCVGVTLSYVLAFIWSARAFDIDLRFAALGVVYLVGAAVASAAPTPGGLGAAEAALIGGLVAVGVEHEKAVPAVLLFRLVTYWLPILPGWVAFRWLRKAHLL